jgi:hypothetical protein
MPDQQMDDLLTQSNKVQADRYAANPVTANPTPDPNAGLIAQGAGVSFPSIPKFVSQTAEGLATGGAGYSSTPPATPVSSALTPRPPVDMTNTARNGQPAPDVGESVSGAPVARGPIQTAVDGGLPDGVTKSGNSYSGNFPGPAPGSLNSTQQGELNAARPSILQAAQDENAYNQAGYIEQRAREDANRPGYADLEQAKSAARVAEFERKNGQVSGLQSGRNLSEGKAAFAAVSDAANKRVSDLEAAQRAPGVQAPKSNFVQNAQAANEATNKSLLSQSLAQRTAAEGAESQSRVALTKEELAQKKQFTDAYGALHNAKTPEERDVAMRNVLAMHGKAGPGWKAVTIGGGINPDTGQANPQSVLVYNEQTNEKQLYDGGTGQLKGGDGVAPAAGGPKDGEKRTMNVNGKPVTGKYNAKTKTWEPV